MKYGFILAFVLLAIIQWVVPGKIIWEKDEVLKKGESFKFKTEPVDPSHPFKGKYITLNFAENSFTDTINRNLAGNESVYVILGRDARGFAIIKDLSTRQPQNNNYVKATVYYASREKDSITVHIRYPFDEFYMDEYKAPKAETIYREPTRDSSATTYALVKIRKGQAVIQNVFINDIPIGELTR
ncbi:MAG: GDYXXLXY domain-containing protein [Chitinophagaceae bacterium]|nr:GDYXXLXY domain-containing protein [Chitinophagaceae bacterium]